MSWKRTCLPLRCSCTPGRGIPTVPRRCNDGWQFADSANHGVFSWKREPATGTALSLKPPGV